jgi:hypothetical protein
MPQDQKKSQENPKADSKENRNKPASAPAGVGTSSSKELNEDNSSEVRDAMNESQV